MNFLKKFLGGKTEIKEEIKSTNTIVGMILLEEEWLDFEKMIYELKGKWNLKIDHISSDKKTLKINWYTILIINENKPISKEEIKTISERTLFRDNIIEETDAHKSHITVVIHWKDNGPIQSNLLFNKIIASIMNHSKSIGIYIGDRSLLLKKDFYIYETNLITENILPISTWIYIGSWKDNNKCSWYTYGLNDFGKREIEIINSEKSTEEIFELLYRLTSYVIESNITFKDKEYIDISNDEQCKISISKGIYLENTTIKVKC